MNDLSHDIDILVEDSQFILNKWIIHSMPKSGLF